MAAVDERQQRVTDMVSHFSKNVKYHPLTAVTKCWRGIAFPEVLPTSRTVVMEAF
jgi:hypothetical protein